VFQHIVTEDDVEGPVGIRDVLLPADLELDVIHSSRFGIPSRLLNHAFERFDATDAPGAAPDLQFTGLPAISASEIKDILVSDGFT
jgi:hypothetical protein